MSAAFTLFCYAVAFLCWIWITLLVFQAVRGEQS